MKNIHFITKATVLFSAAALCAAPAVWAQNSYSSSSTSGTKQKPESNVSHRDKRFIEEAAKDGQTEVALADLAATKAQNAQLKTFAQQLKQEHQQANQQLMQIAQRLGVQVSASDQKEREISRFQKYTGAEFDKEFATQQLKDHEKDIQRFEKQARDGENPELKQFASQMVPKLQGHLDHVAQIARSVGVDQSTISSALRKSREAVGGTSDMNSTSGTGHSSTWSDDAAKNPSTGTR